MSGCSGARHANVVPPAALVANDKTKSTENLSPADLESRLPDVADADIDKNIDAALPADERKVMHDFMLQLPHKARSNVIYVDGHGRIYANRVDLKNGTHLRYKDSKGRFADESGHLYAAPPTTARPHRNRLGSANAVRSTREYNPPQTTVSGPYIRFLPVYSGYTKAVLGLIVPDYTTASNGQGPNGDTGYVYTGGWNDDGSDAVDAGFQYSAYRNRMKFILSVECEP